MTLPAAPALSSALRYLANEAPHVALPDYLSADTLPIPQRADGQDASIEMRRGLLRHLARTALLAGDPMEPALRAALDPESVGAFVWGIFLRWHQAGMPWAERWCLAALGPWGRGDQAAALGAQIPRWQREGRASQAALALSVLRRMDSPRSLAALRAFSLGSRWRVITEEATAQWAEAARSHACSPEEFDDRALYAQAPREAFDEDGFAALTRTRARALEAAMIAGRRWPAAAWWSWVSGSPEASQLASSLVWSLHGPRPRTARFSAVRGLLSVGGIPLKAAPDAEFRLLHPISLPAAQRARWLRVLQVAGVASPFPQLDREVFAPPAPPSGPSVKAFGATTVPPGWLHGHLRRRGWDRTDPEDNGNVKGCYRFYEAHGVTALVMPGLFWVGGNYELPAPVEIVFLRGAHTRSTLGWSYRWAELFRSDAVEASAVPPVAYSEAVRDVAQLVQRAAASAAKGD